MEDRQVIFFTKQAYSLPVRNKVEHLLEIIRLNGFDSLKLQCSKHCSSEISSKLWVSLLNLVLNQKMKINNCWEISYFNWIAEFLNSSLQILFQSRNLFLGIKPIWNSKAEMPMSVIKSNQDIKFNLNIQERKAYTVLNRFCHVMCQSRLDTIPLYLVARWLPGARQGQTHFEFALKFLYH